MEEKMLNKNPATKDKNNSRTKYIVGYTTPFLSGLRRGDSQLIEMKGGKKIQDEKRDF
jgi:hypothetical protein